jgi:platelet-activating factor acetylhydrolase IB subunit beta/gamma
MKAASLLRLLTLLLCALLPAAAKPPPDQPEAGPDRIWIAEHLRLKKLVRNSANQPPPDVFFLGDSITAYWPTQGKDSWRALTQNRRALNAGLSGDTTQNILYRITHGGFDPLQPKVIVLMAGLNNLALDPKLPPTDLIKGLQQILTSLQTKSPRSKVLLLSLLPSAPEDHALAARIRETNRLLPALANQTNIFFADVYPAFLDAQSQALPYLTSDGTHPNAAGYRALQQIVAPVLAEISAK